MLDKIAEYRKALAGILVPGLTVLGLALTDASPGGASVTPAEWVAVALAALGTGTAVAAVPNRTSTGKEHRRG